jgi:subtilisin
VFYEFAFDALTLEADENAIRGLRRRGDIRYVELDGEMEALAQTLPYGIDRVDAEVAHANGETGGGADVAIIDTGIDSTHPDLEANLGKGRSFVTTGNYPAWQDDNGHGTHCAGIADAVDNSQGVVGVSTEATLHAVKVLSSTGVGLTSDVAAGIEYTADQGWDVGSLSLGGGDADVLKDACNYAYNNGVLLSAAAGNSGPCTDCVGYPAAYQECIAVSATDRNDDLADFSSTGPEVELAAPGVNIYSTYVPSTYTELSGTSMSCPHVSGAAGQLMANGYTNTEARDRLGSTAEDIGLASNEQGNGLLDVAAALGLDSSDDL